MNLSINVFLIIFLSIILIAAAVNDLRFQKIPNLLTYPSMAIAVGCHVVMNGLDGLLFSAGDLALGIAVFILPYLMGGMGFELRLKKFVNRKKTNEKIDCFLKDKEGAAAVEYSLIVALIAVVIILTVVFLGQQVEECFNIIWLSG